LTYRVNWGEPKFKSIFISAWDILATYRLYLKHSCDGNSVLNLFRCQYQTNTLQYNTIQYNTIQYNTIAYNTIYWWEKTQLLSTQSWMKQDLYWNIQPTCRTINQYLAIESSIWGKHIFKFM
jgi:hypothetical protein